MTLISRLILLATVAFAMQPHELSAGQDVAPARIARQGTVVGLDGYSLAVERIEQEDDPRTVRLTIMPEPTRAWAASGVFLQGEWLVLHDRCYQLARFEPSDGKERGSVLLKGPKTQAGCGFGRSAIPVFAGEAGTRIGETRIAMLKAPRDAAAGAVDVVSWPSHYTWASCPEDERQHQRVARGAMLTIDRRSYALSDVHARGDGLPAFIELEPR